MLSPDLYGTVDLSIRDLTDQLSGDYLPAKFYGLECSTFGSSRKNPFFKLKAVAINIENPIEDRMRAVRFMDQIPHVQKVVNTVEAAISIIEDERTPIGERYFFMSNHEKQCKLSDHVVRDCHLHFFGYSKSNISIPLILRLLSAQYIYCTFAHCTPAWVDCHEFIINLALDVDETVRIRSEAADILCRKVNKNDSYIGIAVIKELGELYNKNKMSSIYTNAQNAHNESITESVMNIIRALLAARSIKASTVQCIETFTGDALAVKGEENTGNIYERLLVLTANNDRKSRIFAAFNYILIYPAKYEGITLSDVLCLVWNKICDQPLEIKSELEIRLLQELFEMDETCGSGLCSRLINVLSGFVEEEGMQIKMSFKDQLRANVFARLQANMRMLSGSDQDTILAEMAEDDNPKMAAKEFVESYTVRPELLTEFVGAGLLELNLFEQIYNQCIADFLGLELKEKIVS